MNDLNALLQRRIADALGSGELKSAILAGLPPIQPTAQFGTGTTLLTLGEAARTPPEGMRRLIETKVASLVRSMRDMLRELAADGPYALQGEELAGALQLTQGGPEPMPKVTVHAVSVVFNPATVLRQILARQANA